MAVGLQFSPRMGLRAWLPKEHGGWAILFAPLLIGLGVSESWGARSAMVAVMALSLYLARYPFVMWARSRFRQFPVGAVAFVLATSAIGMGLGLTLVLAYDLYLLLAFGAAGALLFAVHLLVVRSRRERSTGGEFLGIVALTMAAPVAFYAASGNATRLAFLLWLLSVLYFGASVFYVKMRVVDSLAPSDSRADEGRRLRLSLIVYVAIAVSIISLLSDLDLVPALAVTAFVPMVTYTLYGVFRKQKRLSIRRLGFSLLGHSVLFTVAIILVFVFGA